MKPKLSCCEINKKSPNANLECDGCECFFESKEKLDAHNREIHKGQSGVKRKMYCCKENAKKSKPNQSREWQCDYCECSFGKEQQRDDHTKYVHKLPEIVFTNMIRDKRQREEDAGRQKQRDEDLVLNYIKTDKLDEYQAEPGYEPDFYRIFHHYDLSKEELLKFVQKFDIVDILPHYDNDTFTFEEIEYLLDNDVLSIEDVAGFMDGLTYSLADDEIMFDLVGYFLDEDHEIKREWVAKTINDDALMERIKQKYTFTFDEVYEAREEDSMFDQERWDEFYVQVHKHFPNPDFKDPFADPYEDFKRVSTEHVRDHLQNRYFYDEESDKLSIVVGYYMNEREILLGGCKEMLQENLSDLIERYNRAIEGYDTANARVNKLFEERQNELDAADTQNERDDILEDYYADINRDALPVRNDWANEVSKLYFVIAMNKPKLIDVSIPMAAVTFEQSRT